MYCVKTFPLCAEIAQSVCAKININEQLLLTFKTEAAKLKFD